MFPPQRCSLLLLIQPPSVVACLWVSAFSFVLPESTHCWTLKTILFPRLICLHCKVLPKQFCNWDYSPVHFTLLLLSTIKSSVHTSNPNGSIGRHICPCANPASTVFNTWCALDHGLFFLSPNFIHNKRWIQTTVKAFFWAKSSLFLSVTRRLHPVHSHYLDNDTPTSSRVFSRV